MLWHFYLRKGAAYVPTVAQTEAGFYMDIEPVEVVPLSNMEALQRAVKQAISRGNPRVSTPSRATFPKPVVLSHAKVKSWSTFEESASCWQIVEKDGSYQMGPMRTSSTRGLGRGPKQHTIHSTWDPTRRGCSASRHSSPAVVRINKFRARTKGERQRGKRGKGGKGQTH